MHAPLCSLNEPEPGGSIQPMYKSLVFLLMLLAGGAYADEDRSDVFHRIYVLQPSRTIVGGRIEATPFAGYVVNDAYFHQVALGGSLGYHITDEWGVGANFAQYFTDDSGFYSDVKRDYYVYPENVQNEWSAGGHLIWSPIRGKMALYPLWVTHLRLYAKVGAGALKTSIDLRPAGEVGLGLAVHMLSFWTLNLELTDQMYVEHYAKGRDEFKNQILVRLGFGFLIPVL